MHGHGFEDLPREIASRAQASEGSWASGYVDHLDLWLVGM